jgi:peptidoglycan/xylan/chitin deacetylase (PgdA/CDA1 family)
MYHHVSPHRGDTVTVTPEVFEGQMHHLGEAGYRTLTAGELLSFVSGELTLQGKAVVITFDDGWLDNYLYAFPVLKKYQLNATVFLITDRTDMASGRTATLPDRVPTHNESKALIEQGEAYRVALNWKLVGEMEGSGLVKFYSHTRSHRKCDTLSEKELLRELEESKRIMEEKLGRPCPYLCWPYGRYDQHALNTAKDVGYRGLFTTEHGVVQAGSDPFAIKRIVVKDNTEWFRKRMCIYTNPVLSPLYLTLKKK